MAIKVIKKDKLSIQPTEYSQTLSEIISNRKEIPNHNERDLKAIQLMQREIEFSQQANHPNVIKLLDFMVTVLK